MYYIILAEIAKAVNAPTWVPWLCYICEALDILLAFVKAYLNNKE